MPLVLPGASLLGPRSLSMPATLIDYLESISRNSFCARWLGGVGMSPNSDGTGGVVADGGAVGCWAPVQNHAFSFKFIQPTSASRPAYGVAISSLGPAIVGNGLSWWMQLNSTTALNRDMTILVSYESTNTAGAVFSQGGANFALREFASSNPALYVDGSPEPGSALSRAERVDSTGTAWCRFRRVAISSGSSITRYGHPLVLMSYSGVSMFSNCRLREIAIVPKLTSEECQRAVGYLA